MTVETRIGRRFRSLKDEGRGGLVIFVTAGDPNPEISLEIIKSLPAAGADIIELGMPFSDPMADGPAVQASSLRELKSGASMKKTLDLARAFRAGDDETPLVLMGYYNPIYIYGVDKFLADAKTAGVDGLIIVDLPPEENEDLCLPAVRAGINFIFLTTPTTDNARLPKVVEQASGFVYYVSITGTTGTASADLGDIKAAVERIGKQTDLPIAVGFGIRTPEQAAAIAQVASAAVVGSGVVDRVAAGIDENGVPRAGLAGEVLGYVAELAAGIRKGAQ